MQLRVNEISVRYGTSEILHDVSSNIYTGEVVVILGANGAGKTTLLRAISGLVRPIKGNIELDGKHINNLSPDVIVSLGISHCPEGRMLFPEMPVHKNLELGAYLRRRDHNLVEKMRQQVYELFPILKERKNQLVGTMSGGEQQMLAIGRALMSNPELLMLDEPSLALSPLIVRSVMDAIVSIKERGVGILLVEQNAAESLRIADRGYVMETGSIMLSGTSESLKHDERVRQSYLGA